MYDYGYLGPFWTKQSLTYYFEPSPYLSYTNQAYISNAFEDWEAQIGLDFSQTYSWQYADIVIGMFPVDGSGGDVGGTFWSNNSANVFTDAWIYFDSDDLGESSPGSAYLYETALHEIGHAIGLSHTENPATIMYPYIDGPATRLTDGDITGAQGLYGTDAAPLYYAIGWNLQYNFDYELGWNVDWTLGWNVSAYTGWGYVQVYSWEYVTSWGWGVGWGWSYAYGDYYGWYFSAQDGWTIGDAVGWHPAYYYGWHLFEQGTYESVSSWDPQYGDHFGWNVSWHIGWNNGWHQAWGWHWAYSWFAS